MGFLTNLKEKMSRFSGKVDDYQEAITFAEAGEQEYARELIKEPEVEEKPARLLVVGKESDFSREIIDYALEMAQRMSYEIIALNTAPLSCDTFKLFSSSRDKVCQEFEEISEKNFSVFQEEAAKNSISLTHVVKFIETDDAIEDIRKELGDIDFVVSDYEEEGVASRAEDGQRLRQEMFVYSVV